jgi:parallel beta-helix repeat protein
MHSRVILTTIIALSLILPLNIFTFNASSIPAAVISTASGTAAGDRFGWNVSDCGDVNGDGIDDVIVGAPGYNSDQGRAYIFFGGSSLIGDLDSDSADVILDGSWAGAQFGWDVSGAGDYNGDGINDTIVGAPGNNSNTGATYIFYGSASMGGTISSNNANITIDGESNGDFFGSSVSDLGDVSKVPPTDHVVLSEIYANAVDETSPNVGEFVELYNPTPNSVLLDNWVIEDMDSHSFTIMGTIPSNGFFLIAIDNYPGSTDPIESSWPAPDFDCGYTSGSFFANAGDEIRLKDDIGAIIDTFGYGSSAEWYEGAYYPPLPNPWESYERKLGETMPNGGNAIDTDSNENDFAVRLSAEPQNTFSATEVSPNQSIYDDVIVGAYGYGNDKGRAYVFFGSSGVPNIASDADVILTGMADNHLFGFSVSGARDVNSDGFDDILVGAPGYDNNRGRSYIYYGAQEMKAWTQDIQFGHWDESDGAVLDPGNIYAIYEKRWLGQSFTPDQDYLLTKLWLYLESTGVSSISISIEGDSSGPDGNILAQADPKPSIPPGPTPLAWMEFELTTPFQASASTMYWITARATGKNTNNCWGWLQDLDSNPNYTGGYSAFIINPPGTWTEEPDYDYWFKALGRLPAEIKPDVTLTGGAQGDLFGWSVSDAGDIGGDGIDDIIIGAPGTTNGNAYLINGSTVMKDVTVTGIGWGDEKQFTNWESGGDLEPAVYSSQFVAQSFIPQETYLQTNVSLLVKTFGTPGTLTIKLMGSSGSPPDTVPDGIVLAQAPSISSGSDAYEWTDFEWITPYTCTAGTEYFIVAEGTGSSTTNCWGWFAQDTGTYPDGDSAFDQGGGWTAYDADFYFRASGRSETALPNITFQGESPGDMFGYSVSDAGNFNGDAFDDVVVGAPGNGNGKVYIFNCSNTMPPAMGAVGANYTAMGENPIDNFGWSVSAAGNVNTTVGNFEVIVGAPFQDPMGLNSAGRVYILSISATLPPPPLQDLPFRINNDAEFAAMAAAEGWVGDGSPGNPYIIEDYEIDGDGYGYCIYIGNTTASYIIRNCRLSNASGNAGNYFWDSGLGLYDAPNGVLTKNIIENCTGDAFHVVGTTDLTITQNDFLNSTGSGVYLESSTGNTLDDNTFDNNNYGLEMSAGSDSNTVTNNRFTNNFEGIDLWNCDGNVISNNYGSDNSLFAYLFSWCEGNEILNNTIVDSNAGIYLQSNCNGNTIQNNTITDMTQEGLIIESSSSNTIESNDVQRCREGIYTILGTLNTISNNTLSNNSNDGIYLDPSSDQNTISNNTIADNGDYGILMISADFNIIIYNDIINNTDYGIYVEVTADDNEIHHNTLSDNSGGDVQAYDDGTNNVWDDGTGEGNLWGDYEKRYVPPASSNGKIWNIPYDINGTAGAQDRYPLSLYPWNQDLRIDNNTDFADTAAFWGWAGDGSSSNPFIIEGLTLDAGGIGYGIYIGNTTVHFIIRNSSVDNSSGNSDMYFRNTGIYLRNATNGTLYNNEIKVCEGNGINIEYSKDIVLMGNRLRYNDWSGIYVGYYSNITIKDNTCLFNNWSGVWLWSTSDSYVINNTLQNNTEGITLEWSNGIIIEENIAINGSEGLTMTNSDLNTIANNTFSDNKWEGVYMDQSDLNTLSNNTCQGNYDGIYLSDSHYNTISENQVTNNTAGALSGYGIFLDYSDYNTISKNNCSGNKENGMEIFYSDYNTIDNNTCQDNLDDGISVYKSVNVTISNNTLTGNQFGLFVENRCYNNTIENNNISYNTDIGIYLMILCNNNTFKNNTITGNGEDGIYANDRNAGNIIEGNTISENGGNGINLTYDSDEFIIIYNEIISNIEYGIQILDSDCENNLIHRNGFYNNNGTGVQAYDNGSNDWDNGYPSGGNYWSDYIGVDFNSTAAQDVPPPDGFGDTPYYIIGDKGARDRYPLITFPWTPPPPTGLPEISDVTALPDPQETGGLVNISCNVTDADGVSEVWVNITLPSGGYLNTSMSKGSGDEWFDYSVYSLLGIHNYVIWAKDVAGVWNSSTGHAFTIQDTTPPFIFNVQNIPSPQQAGGLVNISCEVTDIVGVSGVWVNISDPAGGFTNVSMTKGSGDEWFFESSYALLGGHSYMIWANDSSGNWDVSMNNNFNIIDTTPPVISNVLDSPDPQSPGGNVNITCDVTDNLMVYGVWINITLPGGGYTNISMAKGAADEWFLDSTYFPTGLYNYVIWANDTEDNWASSPGYAFLIDDSNPPVISNILDTPDPQLPGGSVNITCDVTDDVGVSGVWVNITLPGGGYSNSSMIKGAADEWILDSNYVPLGIYNYVIWANDTNDNWASSSGHSFTISDGNPPVISNILNAPDPQETGGSVNISCDVTDDISVSEVWVNITLPGGGFSNVSMNKGVGDKWYLEQSYIPLGTYDYVIWAKDSSDNWASSIGLPFTIQDTTLPVISNVQDIPDPQEYAGQVNISCDVTDNLMVSGVWVNITLPGGGYSNVTLDKGALDNWYVESPYFSLGTYDYVIWAKDTADNWASSSGHTFLIRDTTPPVISNVLDSPDPQEFGGFVNISCDVTDNVGVSVVWVNISSPSGGSSNVSMTKGVGDGWFLDSSYFELGTFDYMIWAEDTSGNWINSPIFSFMIQDTQPPEITNILSLPILQIIGGFVNLSCDVIDNVGVSEVWIEITRPDSSSINISMTKGPGNGWYDFSAYALIGDHDYIIWAKDGSGNWNSSIPNTFTIESGPSYNIILISGDGQSGIVGTLLASPYVVEVQDQFGNILPNALVWFNVTSGGGSLDIIGPQLTDSLGRCRTNLTLGTAAGINSVTAEIAGGGISQVVFVSIANPGMPYDVILISGDGQSAAVGTQPAAPLIVEVVDSFGNIVPNADIWFNITSGEGVLDILGSQKTDVFGRAQVNLTLGSAPGQITVTAEIASNGINQVIFTIQANAGSPYDIIIVSGNGQSARVGESLQDPLIVEVTDQFGNPIFGAEVWFNITFGNGTLDILGPITTDTSGRAQTNLTLGPNPGSNTVDAEIVGEGNSQVTFLAQSASNKPEISGQVPNIELLEDDPPYYLYLFAFAVDDEDLPVDLAWYINDYDSSLYSIGGQGTNIIMITPNENMYGYDLVTLMVVDSSGLSATQPLWINITPVNDKPYFFPEPPDLTVTKDLAYTFNYAPYLLDVDNPINELSIVTDDPDHTAISGKLITYLYPESFVGQQVFVTLTLSDGQDSSQTVIMVNVTEDSVPVLKQELPDVVLYEGERKYDVFNLDNFFYDPDGDSVYFSYGYSNINIIINADNSVDFFADGDWFGQETVTFRARDPSSAISEDTILVRVIPVNDPPIISGVPDLIVHYDWDYTFDLRPYIMDADNTTSELSLSFMETLDTNWLISQNINVSEGNNLGMLVNYSNIYLGETFRVKVIVFDGVDFAWQEINVTVSENWQPELEKELPDVVFYEDEYITDEFNVYEFFTDRDGDALFFTYGNKHIQVHIQSNGSVDFTAETENITIRASDPTGAIVENILTVTVLPVNDPPQISSIPDQEGFVGVTWVFDLTPYIHDDDDNITELSINCNSQYVTVVGNVLVFQYPNDIREDSVWITIYDPDGSSAETSFSVDLKEQPTVAEGDSDLFTYILLFIIIAIIVILLLVTYVYMRGRYDIEEVLLVYREKGILISHVNKGQEEKMDRDLMTGMFTAIQDFVGDVFESEGADSTQLKEMELGDKKVLIEHGQYTYIATVFKGNAKRILPKIQSTLVDVETEFIQVLEGWDGEIEAFDGVDNYLEDLMKT